MKNHLIAILLLLFASQAGAQSRVLQKISAIGYEHKAIKVDSMFVIPSGDSLTMNGYSAEPGALYLLITASGDTTAYVHTGEQWKKIGQDTVYIEGYGIDIVNNVINVDTLDITSRARMQATADSLSVVLLPRDLTRDSVIAIGDPRWLAKEDSLIVDEPLFSYIVQDTARHIGVRNRTSVWSAVDLMGIEIEPGTPSDGSVLTYSQAAGRWMHSIGTVAYGNKVMADYASYREDKMKAAMEKMYLMILELRRQIDELKK